MSRLDKFCLPDGCMLSFNPRKAKMTSTETKKQYKRWFKKIKLGSPIIHKGVAVYPIFSEITSTLDYLGLTAALERKVLKVTEINEGGSVPELRVKNTAKRPILLVDGEELEGAKQNRTLNSSILVPAESEIKIPVSCTEQGRWNYSGDKHFESSGHVLESKTRARKMKSVSKTLYKMNNYSGNQSEVWNGIHQFETEMANYSPTSAHKDVYKQKSKAFENGFSKFRKLEEGQQGVMVVIDGHPVGLDFVSRPEVYAEIHEKLIKSYVFAPLHNGTKSDVKKKRASRAVAAFLARAQTANARAFDSVGHGFDLRAEAKHLVGTALNHEQESLHVSFLSLPKGFSRRSRTRRQNRGSFIDYITTDNNPEDSTD